MFQVALALQPYADFMVSSESYGPVQGWDYPALLRSAKDGFEPGYLFKETAEKYLAKVSGRYALQQAHACLGPNPLTTAVISQGNDLLLVMPSAGREQDAIQGRLTFSR